jgi:hypothetical protein
MIEAPPITVTEVFGAAGLKPFGPVGWGTPLPETLPGVYVVAVVGDLTDEDYFEPPDRERWQRDQPVVYIGRTRQPLSKRIKQFYRHKHGRTSPHRGGQAVLLLLCKLCVYWAPTQAPVEAEREMIEAFLRHTGALPYANRKREVSARLRRAT